ncbi:MAG: hypothetical protein CL758_07070 [Chloroflexi bacterium]|nr:hypothetical protein [Chloroflexota bacterium]|tara:strand:+ start:11944 stop:12483 length:540 start_codon:yes stop_codon:yes gene_type:complete
MNLYKILKNNFDTFFIFKVISIIGIITAASIILIMVFTTLGMWKESINIVPNEQNIIISETTKQSPLTARKIREWEQIEIVNKYWESINNLNADIAISLLTEDYKIIKKDEINKIISTTNKKNKFEISNLSEPFMICPKVWAITFYINEKDNEKIMKQIKLKNTAGTWQISYIGEPEKC